MRSWLDLMVVLPPTLSLFANFGSSPRFAGGSAQALRRRPHLLAEPDLAGVAVVAAVPDHRERDRGELDRRLIDAQAQRRRDVRRQALREGGDHLRMGDRLGD